MALDSGPVQDGLTARQWLDTYEGRQWAYRQAPRGIWIGPIIELVDEEEELDWHTAWRWEPREERVLDPWATGEEIEFDPAKVGRHP